MSLPDVVLESRDVCRKSEGAVLVRMIREAWRARRMFSGQRAPNIIIVVAREVQHAPQHGSYDVDDGDDGVCERLYTWFVCGDAL